MTFVWLVCSPGCKHCSLLGHFPIPVMPLQYKTHKYQQSHYSCGREQISRLCFPGPCPLTLNLLLIYVLYVFRQSVVNVFSSTVIHYWILLTSNTLWWCDSCLQMLMREVLNRKGFIHARILIYCICTNDKDSMNIIVAKYNALVCIAHVTYCRVHRKKSNNSMPIFYCYL